MTSDELELIEQIKELRHVIHAGFVTVSANLIAANDNINDPKHYQSLAFVQMQDVLGSLRQGD